MSNDLDLTSGRRLPPEGTARPTGVPMSIVDPSVKTTQSMAARLKELIREQLRPGPITMDVPNMPGVFVTYSGDVTLDEMTDYGKLAGVTDAEDLDNRTASRSMAACMAYKCLYIKIDGEKWVEDGEPVTFRSKILHDSVGTDSWLDAVLVFYGSEMDVITTGNLIATNAGLGARVHPTTAS